MTIKTSTNQDHEGASAPALLLRRGVGLGAATVLLTAGAASAATDHEQSAEPAGGISLYVAAPAAASAGVAIDSTNIKLNPQAAWKAPHSSVNASPRTLTPGQRITITGNAPRSARAGQWVTLKSHAFSSRFTSDGIPSVRAPVLVNGTYRVTVTLRRSLSPTTYTVRGTYKGQPLDTVARISVRQGAQS